MMRATLLMMRTALLIVLLSVSLLAQTAQKAPAPQFLLRLEPVRAGFTLQNMTDEERKLALAHAGYLRSLLTDGKLTFAGQAFDPKGFFGVVIVNAPDMQSARGLLEGDPSVKGNLFRGEVVPFRTVFERAASAPPKAQ